MNRIGQTASNIVNIGQNLTMNSSNKGGSGFDPELAKKIEALEKEQALQRRCPHCGAASRGARLTCENCGNYFERGAEQSVWDNKQPGLAKFNPLTEEEEQLAALKSYLVRRVIAKLIDTVIVFSLVFVEFLAYFGLAGSFSAMPQFAALMLTIFYWVMPVVTIGTVLVYPAAFEASPVQATLGKLLLGLYVVDSEGKPARCEPLIFKAFLSCLPMVGFAAVYLHFFMTRWRYGMQLDALSTSVLAISGVAFFITFLAMHIILGSEKKRQTIPDLLTGIMVQER